MTKLKVQSSKEGPNPKYQSKDPVAVGVSAFGIGASFGFGHWTLVIHSGVPRNIRL
jgi:hypothetical protein